MDEVSHVVRYFGDSSAPQYVWLHDVLADMGLSMFNSSCAEYAQANPNDIFVFCITKENQAEFDEAVRSGLISLDRMGCILVSGETSVDDYLLGLKSPNNLLVPYNTSRAMVGSMISFYLCSLEQHQALKLQLNQATQAAFSAMTANAQMGQVAHFFEHAFRCSEFESLGALLRKSIQGLGLEAYVVFHEEMYSGDFIEEMTQAERRLQRHFIRQNSGRERFTETTEGLIVSDKSLSVLIKNMPPFETDAHGQLRDTLATLIEGCQFCIRSICNQKAAHIAEQAKITFFSILSHELRTPMNSISGFSKLLGRRQEGDTYNARDIQGIEAICDNAWRLNSLIEDMLALSEINELNCEMSRFDVRNALFNVLQEFRERAERKQLEFVQEEVNCDNLIYCDVHRVQLMMKCLMSNAVKFTEKGKVSVRLEVVDDLSRQLVLSVADTGVGIASDQYVKLYTPFRQLSEGLSRTSEGAGLGLTVVRQFVEQLNGDITVNSRPGQGSVFTVRIPVDLPED